MKKLLIGLLVLGSLSSFASEDESNCNIKVSHHYFDSVESTLRVKRYVPLMAYGNGGYLMNQKDELLNPSKTLNISTSVLKSRKNIGVVLLKSVATVATAGIYYAASGHHNDGDADFLDHRVNKVKMTVTISDEVSGRLSAATTKYKIRTSPKNHNIDSAEDAVKLIEEQLPECMDY